MTTWRLDVGSGIPLYLQLKQQIIQRVMTGEWKPGYQLPTVRQLSVELSINVNTVSRVYQEVEREGFIRTQQGKGTFVRNADGWAESPDARAKLVRKFASLVVDMAQAQGIGVAELMAALQGMHGEDSGQEAVRAH